MNDVKSGEKTEPAYKSGHRGFTPGPWGVDGTFVDAKDDCEIHPVADCSCNHTCRSEEEQRANARLIAAAPDLYEALSHLVAMIGDCSCHEAYKSRSLTDPTCSFCNYEAEDARTALARARGDV